MRNWQFLFCHFSGNCYGNGRGQVSWSIIFTTAVGELDQAPGLPLVSCHADLSAHWSAGQGESVGTLDWGNIDKSPVSALVTLVRLVEARAEKAGFKYRKLLPATCCLTLYPECCADCRHLSWLGWCGFCCQCERGKESESGRCDDFKNLWPSSCLSM